MANGPDTRRVLGELSSMTLEDIAGTISDLRDDVAWLQEQNAELDFELSEWRKENDDG